MPIWGVLFDDIAKAKARGRRDHIVRPLKLGQPQLSRRLVGCFTEDLLLRMTFYPIAWLVQLCYHWRNGKRRHQSTPRTALKGNYPNGINGGELVLICIHEFISNRDLFRLTCPLFLSTLGISRCYLRNVNQQYLFLYILFVNIQRDKAEWVER